MIGEQGGRENVDAERSGGGGGEESRERRSMLWEQVFVHKCDYLGVQNGPPMGMSNGGGNC